MNAGGLSTREAQHAPGRASGYFRCRYMLGRSPCIFMQALFKTSR
jgi:hypothetical protein